jgi:molybdopterin synthase catalytic subunit
VDKTPSIEVRLVSGPVRAARGEDVPGVGAVVRFEGVVRPVEDGRPIEALEYEAYEPMTGRELTALAHRIADRHRLLAMRVVHSTGRVPAGAASFLLVVAAEHRGPAIRAIEEFIDRLKRDIPLWKVPVWAEGESPGADHVAHQPDHAGFA